jgi:hypothetical protein
MADCVNQYVNNTGMAADKFRSAVLSPTAKRDQSVFFFLPFGSETLGVGFGTIVNVPSSFWRTTSPGLTG